MHVVVIVLGDIGRSPRMQYHTRSLLEQSGCYVTLVGYEGESLIPPLEGAAAAATATEKYDDDYDGNNRTEKDLSSSSSPSRLEVVRFTPYTPPKKLFKPLYLLLRLVGLLYGLLHALFIQVPRGHGNVPVDCVLVQNPPSIPLLLIAYLYCHLQPFLRWKKQSKRRKKQRRPGLVIDWHNLGYTMFDLPDRHPIRIMARWYERIMAPRADGHLTVTLAMKLWLEENFGLQGSDNISVLHDKPPEFFRPTTNIVTRHELMIRLDREFRNHCPDSWFGYDDPSAVGGGGRRSTLFTEETTTEAAATEVTSSGGGGGSRRVVQLRSNRPMLVISSTSWTPDEDFGVLLDACVQLDTKMTTAKQQRENNSISSSSNKPVVPNILIIVTGKGPQKRYYQDRISTLNLVHVRIVTLWLEAEVYPILLGCADLGISLHTSTSGIDLPMKVLDMFGCQVPVLARNFDCLNELVEDGRNGRVFDTSTELSNLLWELLVEEGEEGKRRLDMYRENIGGMTRWRENWMENARDVIWNAAGMEGEGEGVDGRMLKDGSVEQNKKSD